MRITDITIRYFSVPFRNAITVGGGELHHRTGYILGLADDRGQWFYGEVAPLPGLDQVSPEQCLDDLLRIQEQLKGCHLESDRFDLRKPLLGLLPPAFSALSDQIPASVCFGLESALLLLYLRHHPDLLPGSDKKISTPVNGLFIPSDDPDFLDQQIQTLQKSGFKTIKCKIGRMSLPREVDQILQLVNGFKSDIRLRLDGNRSLAPETYMKYHQHLNALRVEYVEEPLPPEMWEKAMEVPWPLALDESLQEMINNKASNLSQLAGQIRYIIVKPATAEGVHGLARLLSSAVDCGVQAVLSSAFNTSLGISALALLPHLIPGMPEIAHGLDTLKYLADDVVLEPVTIDQGYLHMPSSLLSGDIGLQSRFLKGTDTC